MTKEAYIYRQLLLLLGTEFTTLKMKFFIDSNTLRSKCMQTELFATPQSGNHNFQSSDLIDQRVKFMEIFFICRIARLNFTLEVSKAPIWKVTSGVYC